MGWSLVTAIQKKVAYMYSEIFQSFSGEYMYTLMIVPGVHEPLKGGEGAFNLNMRRCREVYGLEFNHSNSRKIIRPHRVSDPFSANRYCRTRWRVAQA